MSDWIDPFRGPAIVLASEIDEYLGGDRTMLRVGRIEGALAAAEDLRGLLDGYEDLETAVAQFAPGQGDEFEDEASLAAIAGLVRRSLQTTMGI